MLQLQLLRIRCVRLQPNYSTWLRAVRPLMMVRETTQMSHKLFLHYSCFSCIEQTTLLLTVVVEKRLYLHWMLQFRVMVHGRDEDTSLCMVFKPQLPLIPGRCWIMKSKASIALSARLITGGIAPTPSTRSGRPAIVPPVISTTAHPPIAWKLLEQNRCGAGL